jgi:hypothetical protein
VKGPLSGFALIELLGENEFQPVQVYKAEQLNFDVSSNFQIINGQILVGIKHRLVAIDLYSN